MNESRNTSSTSQKKAVVLLSGGLDSTTVTALAKMEGYTIYAISFLYDQRHSCELESAKKVADFFNVEKHLIMQLNLGSIGGSALTDNIDVKKNRDGHEPCDEIPATYVPARNTIFLSYALAWAETLAVHDIFIGVNAIDYSGYPDCRPEFIEAFQKMANLATREGVTGDTIIKIHTPLIALTKGEIIIKGIKAGVDYSMTHSCYDPDPKGIACGLCDSCHLRLKGFEEAGLQDPLKYSKISRH
jgi:7-cyano-7-deazaguanine synthase